MKELAINEKLAVILNPVKFRILLISKPYKEAWLGVVIVSTVFVISGSIDTEQRIENPSAPLNLLNKFQSVLSWKYRSSHYFYGLLHVSSGRNKGWLDFIIYSNCDIPQNRLHSETGFNFKL